MRPRWLGFGLIVLALGVVTTRTARAEQPEVVPTAVLGLEAIDVPLNLTDEIVEQLRQRVSGSRDMRLVSGKDLVEVKLVFSCADEAATCMAQAGKSLDAQRLIYGSVKKVGDDYAVWLKSFDVRKGKVEYWLTESLLKKQADAPGIKAISARWFAKLTGRLPNTGTVQITASPSGSLVSLDGVPVGTMGDQPIVLPDVVVGKHELTVAKVGNETTKQQLTVTPGQLLSVNVALQPSRVASGATAPPKTETPMVVSSLGGSSAPGVTATKADTGETFDGYRSGFWVTLAAGLASVGAAVKFGLDVSDVNTRLDPYRRFPCTTAPGQLCDSGGVVKPSLTQEERNQVGNLNDEGTRAQTLQWICIGVGSALGVASGYLFYKGYIDPDEDHARRHAHRGLRIFPSAGASSGGILAEFEF